MTAVVSCQDRHSWSPRFVKSSNYEHVNLPTREVHTECLCLLDRFAGGLHRGPRESVAVETPGWLASSPWSSGAQSSCPALPVTGPSRFSCPLQGPGLPSERQIGYETTSQKGRCQPASNQMTVSAHLKQWVK